MTATAGPLVLDECDLPETQPPAAFEPSCGDVGEGESSQKSTEQTQQTIESEHDKENVNEEVAVAAEHQGEASPDNGGDVQQVDNKTVSEQPPQLPVASPAVHKKRLGEQLQYKLAQLSKAKPKIGGSLTNACDFDDERAFVDLNTEDEMVQIREQQRCPQDDWFKTTILPRIRRGKINASPPKKNTVTTHVLNVSESGDALECKTLTMSASGEDDFSRAHPDGYKQRLQEKQRLRESLKALREQERLKRLELYKQDNEETGDADENEEDEEEEAEMTDSEDEEEGAEEQSDAEATDEPTTADEKPSEPTEAAAEDATADAGSKSDEAVKFDLLPDDEEESAPLTLRMPETFDDPPERLETCGSVDGDDLGLSSDRTAAASTADLFGSQAELGSPIAASDSAVGGGGPVLDDEELDQLNLPGSLSQLAREHTKSNTIDALAAINLSQSESSFEPPPQPSATQQQLTDLAALCSQPFTEPLDPPSQCQSARVSVDCSLNPIQEDDEDEEDNVFMPRKSATKTQKSQRAIVDDDDEDDEPTAIDTTVAADETSCCSVAPVPIACSTLTSVNNEAFNSSNAEPFGSSVDQPDRENGDDDEADENDDDGAVVKGRRVLLEDDEEGEAEDNGEASDYDGDEDDELDSENEEEQDQDDGQDRPDQEAGDSSDDEMAVVNKLKSEEQKRKQNLFKNGRLRRKFVDAEAELSGSDVGSGDEDETGLDGEYEPMEGDADVLPEGHEDQLLKIHQKVELDQDARRLARLKEKYLQDGDLESDRRKLTWRFRLAGENQEEGEDAKGLLDDIEDNTLNVDDDALIQMAKERMLLAQMRAKKQEGQSGGGSKRPGDGGADSDEDEGAFGSQLALLGRQLSSHSSRQTLTASVPRVASPTDGAADVDDDDDEPTAGSSRRPPLTSSYLDAPSDRLQLVCRSAADAGPSDMISAKGLYQAVSPSMRALGMKRPSNEPAQNAAKQQRRKPASVFEKLV